MKTARMLLLAFCCAMLAGCTAPSGGTDALAVYSFCGETAQFSVTMASSSSILAKTYSMAGH